MKKIRVLNEEIKNPQPNLVYKNATWDIIKKSFFDYNSSEN